MASLTARERAAMELDDAGKLLRRIGAIRGFDRIDHPTAGLPAADRAAVEAIAKRCDELAARFRSSSSSRPSSSSSSSSRRATSPKKPKKKPTPPAPVDEWDVWFASPGGGGAWGTVTAEPARLVIEAHKAAGEGWTPVRAVNRRTGRASDLV